jgi:hypothetical protein
LTFSQVLITCVLPLKCLRGSCLCSAILVQIFPCVFLFVCLVVLEFELGLVLARQELYHLCYVPSPLHFRFFSRWGLTYFAWTGLLLWSSYLCLA